MARYASQFGSDSPPGDIPAANKIPNKSAQQERFTTPAYMRVSADSMIRLLFGAEPQTCSDGNEDLS